MTTLKDISRHLNLSVTQVSRALNGHSDVSDDTRKRVEEAARALGYQPNFAARKLVTGRSGIVGHVIPRPPASTEAALFLDTVGGLSASFSRLGMQFVLHFAESDQPAEDVYGRLIASGTIDGFVLTEPVIDDARVAFLRARDVPFTIHGRMLDGTEHAYYDIDNFDVGQVLTRHLTDRGHRRIAFLNGGVRRTYAELRRRGFEAVLAESGARPEECPHQFGPMSEARGLIETIRIFSAEGPRPTAIIAGNLRLAKGIYDALEALGLRVPDDVSVIAHDDRLLGFSAASFVPALTATDAPLSDSWQPLARTLEAAIQGEGRDLTQLLGGIAFVERNSVAPPCTERIDSLPM